MISFHQLKTLAPVYCLNLINYIESQENIYKDWERVTVGFGYKNPSTICLKTRHSNPSTDETADWVIPSLPMFLESKKTEMFRLSKLETFGNDGDEPFKPII